MMSDLCKMIRLAYAQGDRADVVRNDVSVRDRVSVPDTLLGRGNLAIASGRITTGRDMRQMRQRVLEHDFRG